jgi:hypothetical protein
MIFKISKSLRKSKLHPGLMPTKKQAIYWLPVVLFAMLNSGCVSEQYSEFRGTIAHGTTPMNAPSVSPIGAQFQCLDPKFTEALTGFGVSQGDVMFVHDRQKYVADDYRLSNEAVSAVYFKEPKVPLAEKTFLGEAVASRDETKGVHRLQGSFNVEKWKSNIDFRIRLAMQSSETNPLIVNGVLTTYNRWEFRPITAIGLILCSMGLASE